MQGNRADIETARHRQDGNRKDIARTKEAVIAIVIIGRIRPAQQVC